MKKSKQPYETAILSAKKQFISIAGKEVWAREIDNILFYFKLNTAHHSCDPESIKRSVINVAHTGVTINQVFNEAYFMVRDGKSYLDFTYRGLIKIATSEGAVTSINASVVYNWDKFEAEQGTNAKLVHIPNMLPPKNPKDVPEMDCTIYPAKDPDEIARNPKLIWEYARCAYSIATFPNGQKDFIVLPKFKILKTWNMTCANASPINQMFPEEWIRKTAIIYHSKSLPHTQKLVTAVSVINEHEGMTNKKSKPKSRLMQRIKK